MRNRLLLLGVESLEQWVGHGHGGQSIRLHPHEKIKVSCGTDSRFRNQARSGGQCPPR